MSGFQRAQTIYDAISGRRSIRQYSSDDVSPDTVRRLISMAVMAPSARQPWPFVVARAESGRGERDSVFRVRTGGRPTAEWKILGTARRE
jgi:nitroreductase